MTLPATPGAILGYTRGGRPIRVIAGAALDVDTLPADPEQFQTYLDELKDDQLPRLENDLTLRFKELRSSEDPDKDKILARMTILGDQIKATQSDIKRRKTTAAKQRAEDTAAAAKAAMEALAADVLGEGTDNGSGSNSGDAGDGDAGDGSTDPMDRLTTAIAGAFEKATATLQPQLTAGATGGDLNAHVRNHPSLGRVGQHAPDPRVSPTRSEAVMVASADIPGVAKNGRVNGIGQLVQLMGDRARMMSITRGKNPNYVNVAKLVRDFRYKLSLDSTPEEVNEVLTAATDVGALVAAGGWCAPSEISYDFFNIVCEDGLIDLPSVGVLNRGGFRFPQSPSIADVFNSDAVWTWTEADDLSAAEDPGPSKTCARVPCPDFDEVKAACDGLCVTAGNLTDFAYPEMIENYLRIVMAARAHLTNQRVLTQLENASTAVDMTGSGEGSAASILNSVELQVIDYRERYRMCEDAVLEAIFPRWIYGAIRADLANRTGVDLLGVTNAMIADWLNLRSVRAQFVTDWQAGFTGEPFGDPAAIPTTWPAAGDYLLYAPGNFVRGQGLQLDLGVVRDSTLNEKNDHTAAWMEDCYAVAEVGHESRIVTTDINTLGVTGGGLGS